MTWPAANLALNASPACQIITMDLYPVIPGNADIQNIFESASIKFINVDSTQFDFSPYYGAVDFVFIDGSHLAADLEKDSQAALKMISPHGLSISLPRLRLAHD